MQTPVPPEKKNTSSSDGSRGACREVLVGLKLANTDLAPTLSCSCVHRWRWMLRAGGGLYRSSGAGLPMGGAG
jgi:hypothetical protein